MSSTLLLLLESAREVAKVTLWAADNPALSENGSNNFHKRGGSLREYALFRDTSNFWELLASAG